MRKITCLFLSVLLVVAGVMVARAADANHTHVRALLVLASNQKGQTDPQLAGYEPNLRRILRFESYRLAGEGAAELAAPGKAAVSLGRGHGLELEAEKSDGKSVHLRVSWQGEGRSLMNTGLVLRPGLPAILGGPSSGKEGEVWAIILVAD
jgi:hypothetical protein